MIEAIRRAERRVVDAMVARDVARSHRRIAEGLPDVTSRSPHCAHVRVVSVEQGRVRVSPRRRHVLILGAGQTRRHAPLNDPRYEVWCCNDLAAICTDADGLFRADRWFELHPRDAVVQWRRRHDFWDWLSTMPIPVYQFTRRDAPQSLEFPLTRVIAAGRDYFGCTFAYQIGLAIAEGFTTIALYGCDLETAREATVERATVEWWAGYASGRGIRVEWPEATFPRIRAGQHPYRYAYPESCEDERELVYRWIRSRFANTIPGFLLGNRPPWTLAEYWRWRRARS